MKPVILRLEEEMRTRLDGEAALNGVTVTDLMRALIEQRYGPGGRNPFDATHTIPMRMLEVETWCGLTVLESARSLAAFGVASVAELATPEVLLAGVDQERLQTFAQLYEVDLDWLLNGEGAVYRPTHTGWYVSEIARRITRLWTAGQLTRVRFVTDRSGYGNFSGARIMVVLEKRHPVLREFTVNESFPVVYWDKDQRWLVANLILFCLELHLATHAHEPYPSGATLMLDAFESMWRGRLHPALALRDHSTSAWHPVTKAAELAVSTRSPSDVHDWQHLQGLIGPAVAGWQGRKELLGGHNSPPP